MAKVKTHRNYLAGVKDWKVRNMIQGYLQACHAYQEMRQARVRKQRAPSFEVLKEISDTLYRVKEDHHLIFRRPDEANSKNSGHKLVPGYADTAFIDHVGLLFHKIMVARELRYILEHYAHNKENWEAHFQALQTNLQLIDEVFEKGLALVLEFMRSHSDNTLLLAFFIEHDKKIAKCVRLDAKKVLHELITKVDLPQAYFNVAQYYYDSGWPDRALKAVQRCLAEDARHAGARELLQRVRANAPAHNGAGSMSHASPPVIEATTVAS